MGSFHQVFLSGVPPHLGHVKYGGVMPALFGQLGGRRNSDGGIWSAALWHGVDFGCRSPYFTVIPHESVLPKF